MARFRNRTGYPLVVADLRRTIPPGGEFDWPAYDPARHGTVTGCTRLDEAQAVPAAPPASTPPPVPPAVPGIPPAAAPSGDGKPRTTTAPDGAGKENE